MNTTENRESNTTGWDLFIFAKIAKITRLLYCGGVQDIGHFACEGDFYCHSQS